MLGQATYLAFLLPWAGVVILLHWLVGGPELWVRLRGVALATLLSTLYLSAADRIALGDGIWTISPSRSTGVHVLGLPLEEGLFFLLTSLMVAQSVALFAAPELTARVVLARARTYAEAVAVFARRFVAAWPVGAAAASLSALAGSVLAVVLGAPAALDAPWQLIMVWTPVPIAAWLIDALGDISRPLGLIGAFALYLLVGGIVGTLARPGRWLPLAAVTSGCLWLWLAGSTHPLAAAVLALGPLAAALLRKGRPNPLAPFPAREGGTTQRRLSAAARHPLPLSQRERAGVRVGPSAGTGPAESGFSPHPNPLPDGEGTGPRPHSRSLPEGERTPSAPQPSEVVPPSPAGKGDRGLGLSLPRRSFLVGGIPLFAAVGLGLLWAAEQRIRGMQADHSASPLFTPPEVRPRAAGFPVAGQPPEVTPTDSFYVVSKNVEDPAPLLDGWRMRVMGRVERELSLDFAALAGHERVDQYTTLRCVSNPVGWPMMSNGLWSGVPLAALLEQAGLRADARWVVARGIDGHHEDLPLAVALAPDTLVAYALNGSLLERRHGYPARLVVPGHYGFKNVKWLESVEVVADDQPGYWPNKGWTHEGVMVTAARIDLVRREGGTLLVAGVALAGTRGISRVDVRTVDASGPGEWRPAAVNQPALGRAAWVQWRVEIPAPAGGRVEARAVDGEGHPQEERQAGPFPSGATGLHSVEVPT